MKALTKIHRSMTVISAICCRECIVMASDSRTTEQEEIRDDATKLWIVPTKTGNDCVCGLSGRTESSAWILDRLLSRSLNNEANLVQSVDDTFRAYRHYLITQKYGCSWAELNSFLLKDGMDCELMYCFYSDGSPRIYTISLEESVSYRRSHDYWCIGIGRFLANHFLREFGIGPMPEDVAVYTSIYTVEEVKKSVTGCGGPPQVGIVRRNDGFGAELKGPIFCEHVANELKKSLGTELETWKQKLHYLVSGASKGYPKVIQDYGKGPQARK